MIDFATDPVTDDISLAGGAITAETDQDVIDAKRLQRYFSLWRGEWFLDTRQGLPWYDVLGQTYREVVVRSLIATGARDIGFSLVSSTIDFVTSTRTVSIDATFRRADGSEFDAEIVVPAN